MRFIKQTSGFNSKIISITSLLLFGILWELLARFYLKNQTILPPLSLIIATIIKGIWHGQIINDSLQSIQRVLVGFIIGSTLGLILGVTSSLKKNFPSSFFPIIELVRPIPPIAWIPLSLLWFGFGNPPAYFLVSLGAFFPVFSNTFLGISSASPGTLEVAKCHGASNNLILRKIILPQALPSIFAGLKTGLGVAWMIVITAELVGAQNGLGYFIQLSRAQLQSEQVVSGMVIIGLIGIFLNYIMNIIGRLIMPWRGRGMEIGYGE